ncbi:hypothetical protein [Roseisalinus antarcticus]|uniref:hypothetical protein n=1 Tax=Roseisalinus antarcticus TaxID=254357 RepID=UPI00117BBDAA|nr:hypothetical protein [Roseisalinus antarcticus]
MCIDLAVWHPDDACRLHAAGVVNRCHAYAPATIDKMIRARLDPRPALRDALAAGLIDTLSGDDVGWIAALATEAGVGPAGLVA